MIALETLDRCFHGIVPGVLATCDADGMPNVSYTSQLYLVDAKHVALSCQFFNKTRQNLDVNPLATMEIYDPVTFDAYRLHLRFLRSEVTGPTFEQLSLRIEAIASHTGMSGVFKLRSADICEVLDIERREGFIEAGPQHRLVLPDGPLTECRGLQLVSDRVSRAPNLEALLSGALAALDEVFGFAHGIIMMPDGDRLVTVASHGYGEGGIGAEVPIGVGLIGSVADAKKLVRVASVSADLRYARAIREQYERGATAGAEIPLPHLTDAESQMTIPLLVQDRLIGVLVLESKDALTFAQWHESFLQVLANQIASGIDRIADAEEFGDETTLAFCYYRNDDCVFVDGEYLIRNVPGKILWKVLRAYHAEGRTEFSNRELRLDPSLGLPPVKDNLESRLILLRKRLEQKCPAVRLVPTKRGKFMLAVDGKLDLVERETA